MPLAKTMFHKLRVGSDGSIDLSYSVQVVTSGAEKLSHAEMLKTVVST